MQEMLFSGKRKLKTTTFVNEGYKVLMDLISQHYDCVNGTGKEYVELFSFFLSISKLPISYFLCKEL